MGVGGPPVISLTPLISISGQDQSSNITPTFVSSGRPVGRGVVLLPSFRQVLITNGDPGAFTGKRESNLLISKRSDESGMMNQPQHSPFLFFFFIFQAPVLPVRCSDNYRNFHSHSGLGREEEGGGGEDRGERGKREKGGEEEGREVVKKGSVAAAGMVDHRMFQRLKCHCVLWSGPDARRFSGKYNAECPFFLQVSFHYPTFLYSSLPFPLLCQFCLLCLFP